MLILPSKKDISCCSKSLATAFDGIKQMVEEVVIVHVPRAVKQSVHEL
jgi:hypothetical protein